MRNLAKDALKKGMRDARKKTAPRDRRVLNYDGALEGYRACAAQDAPTWAYHLGYHAVKEKRAGL